MTEATHFSQCVHDQQRRLEAEDCDSIRCAQLISGGRRRIRPPCTVPRSRSPTMRCIRLVIGVSMSESHTSGFNTVYVYIIITMCCMSSVISKIALRGLSYSHTNALHFPRENREKLFSEEFHFV